MAGKLYFEEINIGDEMPRLVKEPVNELQFVKYAGASGDFNPVHTVDAIGKMAGFGGVIAHGMLIMGFVAQAVAGWVSPRCLKKLKVRFKGVTRPGDVITVTGKVIDKKDADHFIVCEVQAADQKGDVKISGQFEAVLPVRG